MNIYPLDKIPADKLGLVGGKARSLNLLSNIQMPIPDGFVITDIQDDADLNAAAEHYDSGGLKKVAVRSSVNNEDSVVFSAAGQFESFLNVEGKDRVRQAISDCLESFNSNRAKYYTGYFSNTQTEKACVIVQEMVEPDIAGVCSTEDLKDPQVIIIDAVRGLGDKLMKGVEKPHTYRVDKKTWATNGDDFLSGEILDKIVAGVKDIQAEFKYPLDIEWALAKDKIYWLQVRPITTTTIEDPFELDSVPMSEGHIYTTAKIKDLLPGAVTPLTLSTVVDALDVGMRKELIKRGVIKTVEESPKGSGIAHFGNHLFVNVTETKRMNENIPGASDQNVETSLLAGGDSDESSEKRNLAWLNYIAVAHRYFNAIDDHKDAIKRLQAWAEEVNIPLMEKSLKWQIEEITSKMEALYDAFWRHYKNTTCSSGMDGVLFTLFTQRGLTPAEAHRLQTECLTNIDGIDTEEIPKRLKNIARELLLDNPRIVNTDMDGVKFAIENARGVSKTAIEAFFKDYGHRCVLEMELRSKSWNMDHDGLAAYIKSMIESGLSDFKESGTDAKYMESVEEKFGTIIGAALKPLIVQARQMIQACEESRSLVIKVLEKFRHAYHYLGKKMVEHKLIPDADLIFFMTHSEILDFIGKIDFDFVKEAVYNPVLIKKAIARKRVFELQKRFVFEDVYVGHPKPIQGVKAAASGKTLTGTPSSFGVFQGKARVIRDLGDINHLVRGEIIVAKFTDIGWTPYFCTAGALVTETGSTLSHGAVIARELALPHITEVAQVTQMIKTGDEILVDAEQGKITML